MPACVSADGRHFVHMMWTGWSHLIRHNYIKVGFNWIKTRKLCCRKDDRAMRHIYGCPEFSGLPDYAHGYYSQHFSWSFVPIHPMNVRTKYEVRSFTSSWDNRGTQNIRAVPGYAHAPFSPKFLMGFIRIGPVNVPAKFEVRSFTFPEIRGGS